MSSAPPATGSVILVGAGPGDPGLLTCAGLEALRAAEVLVFDALANPLLLDEAPAAAERIDCGKRALDHTLTQDEINALLVAKAKEGRRVVRLKGGDPYLFGRGAEEAAFCAAAGVPCRIIPGITSGLAAPAYAGIPVTHRKLASTVTLVTAHEDPTKAGSSVDYAALAGLIRAGGTVCFYMGAGRLASLMDTLVQAGLPADLPAAMVQWGTTPRQRSARATVATLAAAAAAAGLASPAIIVVGRVAGVEEEGLDAFTRRPLFGRTVLVTRTRAQASGLAAGLRELGAEVIEAPTIEVVPSAAGQARLAAALGEKPDWLLLASENAVNAVQDALAERGADARLLAGVRVGCVGEATAAKLRAVTGIAADLVPARATAEALAEALLAAGVQGRRCLLPQADIGRPLLEERLAAAGARVERVVAYETRMASDLPEAASAALREGRVDFAAFTSSSTARNLVTLLGAEAALLARVRRISIGPETSRALAEAGYPAAAEASQPGVAGLLAAVVSAAAGA